jgi:hypothetical protein
LETISAQPSIALSRLLPLFADTMQNNGNNLDKAIDGWADIVSKAKSSASNQQASGT